MRKIILTVCATLIALLGHGQNAGQEFTMQQSEYVVIDNTPYGFARQGSNSREADISVSVGLKPVSDRDMRWCCKYGAELDTMILAVQRNDFYEGGWIDIKKFPNGIAISEYLADNYAKATSESNRKIADYTEKVLAHLESEPWIDKEAVAAQKQAELEARGGLDAMEYIMRCKYVYYLTFHPKEPTSKLYTKTIKLTGGDPATYSYYIEDGEEVKHGQFTAKTTLQNHRSYIRGNYGWLELTGTSTLSCTYVNGLPHGNFSYKCNMKSSSTFNTDFTYNHNIQVNLHYGVITGQFNFTHHNVTYSGNAVNGIMKNLTVQLPDNTYELTNIIAEPPPLNLKLLTIREYVIDNSLIYAPFGVPGPGIYLPFMIVE